MFSYTCEKCGMEVPPAYKECPNCAVNARAAAAASAPAQPEIPGAAPPQQPYPQYAPPQGYPPQPYPPQQGYPPQGYPPQQPYPPQQGYPPQQAVPPGYYPPAGAPPTAPTPGMAPPPTGPSPPSAPPPAVVGPPPPQPHAAPLYTPPPPKERTGTPPWLVTLLVAVIFSLGGYVAYTEFLPKYRASQAAASLESPAAATQEAPVAGAPHRLNKYLEVSGVRIVEEGRKPVVKLTVVNHSAAELTDISGVVELHTTAEKAGSTPLGQVPLKVASIGAYESKDVSIPFTTKLRAYEMPDWQFVRAELKEAGR